MKDKITTLVWLSVMLICSVLCLCIGKDLMLAQIIIYYTCAISAAIAIVLWIPDFRKLLKFNKLRNAISYDLKIIGKAEENHFLTYEEEREFYIDRQNFERIIKSSSDLSNLEKFRDHIKTRFNRFLVSETQ